LTQQEAVDFFNDDVYNYRNEAVIDLPMTADKHDPDNVSGIELLVDGDQEAPTTAAYSAYNNANLTKDTVDPHSGTQCLKVAYDGTSFPGARQFVTVSGKTYRSAGWFGGDATIYPRFLPSGADVGANGSPSVLWQNYGITYVATGNDPRYHAWGSSGYARFDDLSLMETRARTLNAGRLGDAGHALLGDGTTVSTLPTKLPNRRGYETDGDDYIVSPVGTFAHNGFTLAVQFILKEPVANAAIMSVEKDDLTEFAGNFIFIKSAGLIRVGGPFTGEFAELPNVAYGSIYTAIGVFSGTDVHAWLNGVEGTKNTGSFTPTINTDTKATHFVRGNLATGPCGAGTQILNSMIIPRLLTRIQVIDLNKFMMRRINRV
jgi:hypothetical protein